MDIFLKGAGWCSPPRYKTTNGNSQKKFTLNQRPLVCSFQDSRADPTYFTQMGKIWGLIGQKQVPFEPIFPIFSAPLIDAHVREYQENRPLLTGSRPYEI
jgi:hypothetical protein